MCKRAGLEGCGITSKTSRHAYRSQLPHASVEPDEEPRTLKQASR